MDHCSPDRATLIRELKGFKGCQFDKLIEREKIETLVQKYLESPEVHSLEFNKQLLYYLINSEYAPFQVIARTGLQPTGFWLSAFPRAGSWIVYAGVMAIWVVSIRSVLSSLASPLQSTLAWVWIAVLASLTVYHLCRLLRFKILNIELQWLFKREVQPGNFDPLTLSQRLQHFERKYGLKLHSNVFALLRLQEHLQNQYRGIARISGLDR